jgi:hypothetical protein
MGSGSGTQVTPKTRENEGKQGKTGKNETKRPVPRLVNHTNYELRVRGGVIGPENTQNT